VEEIDDIEKTKFRELIFLHNTKVSSTWELKNCIRGEFWRVFEDLHEFFEFNWFCYNIIKIKNILIININLSFFLKITLSKNVKDFTTLPYISIPPKFSLSLPSKLPNKILIYLLSYQYLQVGVFAISWSVRNAVWFVFKDKSHQPQCHSGATLGSTCLFYYSLHAFDLFKTVIITFPTCIIEQVMITHISSMLPSQ